MKNIFKNLGPGPLVAAAFIGPGTVTVCSLAGFNYGYTLLWAMLISVVVTIFLQEMSARIGLISRKNLAEIIRTQIDSKLLQTTIGIVVLSAIVLGNAAYEAGNISGGILGLESLMGDFKIDLGIINLNLYSLGIGVAAFALLYSGSYKLIERSLIALVLILSISFISSAIMTKPDLIEILKGSFNPSIPKGSILVIIGLIGTTVVPYNLFLHSSIVQEKWNKPSDLKYARLDSAIAIGLGGIISMAIIVSASAIQGQGLSNATDLAKGLAPLFGQMSKYVIGVGLFAAGITSAITAPLAASYVASGILNWKNDLKSKKFRAVWIAIILMGVISSSSGFKLIEIIKFAQIANGILLPVIAIILIWISNNKKLLGKYVNSYWQNIFSILMVLGSLVLGIKSILKVLELI